MIKKILDIIKKIMALISSSLLGYIYSMLLVWAMLDLSGNPNGDSYSMGEDLRFYRTFGAFLLICSVLSFIAIKFFAYRKIYKRNLKLFLTDILIFIVALIIFIPVFNK